MRSQNQVAIQSRDHLHSILKTGMWNPVDVENEHLLFVNGDADSRINCNTAFWFRAPVSLFLETRSISQVTGVVYHASRCGSTLLSNILNQVNDIRSLNEPALVNNCLIREDRRLAAFAARLSRKQKTVIKTSSWNLFHYDVLQGQLNNPIHCFVYRDPFEILASFESGPNNWIHNNDIVTDRKAEEPGLVTFSRSLARIFEIGCSLDCLKIEHPDIVEQALSGDLPKVFGYEVIPELKNAVLTVSNVNSKTKAGYVDDREHKRLRASQIKDQIPKQIADRLTDCYNVLQRSK